MVLHSRDFGYVCMLPTTYLNIYDTFCYSIYTIVYIHFVNFNGLVYFFLSSICKCTLV